MLHAILAANTRDTFKISAGYSQTTVTVVMIDLGREHNILQYILPSRSTFTKSVTVSAAVSEIGVVVHEAGSESQWKVLLELTNVRCY